MRRAIDAEEREIADEFLAHGRAIRAERDAAAREGRERRDFSALVNGWGGVTLAYRRRLIDSPGLPAEPRGGAQGARGGHPLRRETCRRVAVEVDADGQRGALDGASSASRTATARSRPRCRRAPCWSPRARQPNTVLRARTRARSPSSTASTSRRSTRTGNPSTPEQVSQAGRRSRVLLYRCRRTAASCQFYGDHHPVATPATS